MLDVMFYEAFKEEEQLLRKFLPKDIRAGFSSKTINESPGKSMPAALISIRTQSQIPLQWAGQLGGILTRSTGYDHILKYRRLTKTNVPSGSLPEYCSQAVAEQAVLMMMALLRKLPAQMEHFKKFSRDGLTGFECSSRNLLVYGTGRIGTAVVNIARGMKMNVRGVDIVHKVNRLDYVSLPKGIKWADVLICAASLTEKTRGALSYPVLKGCRKGMVFVNVSRGEICPTRDLMKLLNRKILSGAGLDVYEHEDLLAESLRNKSRKNVLYAKQILALRKMQNVVLTPHNAFNTAEAVERKAKLSVIAVEQFLKTKRFPNPVPKN